MIIPASSAAAAPVAYSGGAPSTSRPGFDAALIAKLAEMQTMTPGQLHHHHNGAPGNGTANQDAGNTLGGGLAALGTGAIAG